MSEWISRGRVLLSEARENLGKGHYWLACFNAHQAAEYPGRTPGRYDRERAERCISYAERIVEWVEKALEGRGR